MQRVVGSAPGKIIVAGEYAVLDGAPAVAMAIDRRASVAATSSGGSEHTVSATGITTQRLSFSYAAGELNWQCSTPGPGLLECVFASAAPVLSQGYAFTLDSSAFTDASSGIKLGIGSSAAVTVALLAVLRTLADNDIDVAATAMRAHRDWQGGVGSGADIACAVAGGLIEYRRPSGAEPLVSSREWPAGLHFAALWSGVAADSRNKLEALQTRAVLASRAALCDAAEDLAGRWQSGTVSLDHFSEYTDALRAFDLEHDLGIFAAGHARLCKLASADGVVYKPCGAGGGDLGLAIATERQHLEAFVESAANCGFVQLAVRIDQRGVEPTAIAPGNAVRH